MTAIVNLITTGYSDKQDQVESSFFGVGLLSKCLKMFIIIKNECGLNTHNNTIIIKAIISTYEQLGRIQRWVMKYIEKRENSNTFTNKATGVKQ